MGSGLGLGVGAGRHGSRGLGALLVAPLAAGGGGVDGEGGEVLRGILARAALLERGVEEGGGVVGEREHHVVPRVQRVLHGLADELL